MLPRGVCASLGGGMHASWGACMLPGEGGVCASWGGVCASWGCACFPGGVHTSGGGVCASGGCVCFPGGVHASRGCVSGGHACNTPPWPDTTRYGRSMSGRYTSYRNAFLFYSHIGFQTSSHMKGTARCPITKELYYALGIMCYWLQ